MIKNMLHKRHVQTLKKKRKFENKKTFTDKTLEKPNEKKQVVVKEIE